jgi:hypothetical protein
LASWSNFIARALSKTLKIRIHKTITSPDFVINVAIIIIVIIISDYEELASVAVSKTLYV